jgi:hypothetical protein
MDKGSLTLLLIWVFVEFILVGSRALYIGSVNVMMLKILNQWLNKVAKIVVEGLCCKVFEIRKYMFEICVQINAFMVLWFVVSDFIL